MPRERWIPRASVSLVVSIAFMLSLFAPATIHAEGRAKFSDEQRQGYLGKTSRSQIARNVLARIKHRDRAPRLRSASQRLLFWHDVLLDAIALDHTPDPDTGEVDFVQGGPGRTSRALAMTQIAVFDAVAVFDRRYTPYHALDLRPHGASLDAAIAYAAHAMLVTLFPAQTNRFEALLASDLDQLRVGPKRVRRGRTIGLAAASAMLDARANDSSQDPEPQFGEGGRVADGASTADGGLVNGGSRQIGSWEPDPNTPEFSGDFNLSLGAYWGGVKPFVLEGGDEFRVPPPPVDSDAFAETFAEVAALGGSPENTATPSSSTPETRFVGNYWGYDAVPLLGTPPRLYNQIAIQIAVDRGLRRPADLARFLAVVNAALADSGVAAWDSKYYYNYWRPVTGIRRDDGNPSTANDPDWNPVGISVVNVALPEGPIRPTPPFPAYPSGHATFGAAIFEVLRDHFGDDRPFTFVSDEYNGEGVDSFDTSAPRPLVPVRFSSFTEAQRANGISRIYNGVHWQFDNLAGQALGEAIASKLLDSGEAFQPRRKSRRR